MNRRELLKTAVALPLAHAAFTEVAFADNWPDRNITMIVPFPPVVRPIWRRGRWRMRWRASSANR